MVGIINTMAITSDDRFIITGSSDRTIKVFDMINRFIIYKFDDVQERTFVVNYILSNKIQSLGYLSCLITPDDKDIVSITDEGKFYYYSLPMNSGKLFVAGESQQKGERV